jgi:hypothetical protein
MLQLSFTGFIETQILTVNLTQKEKKKQLWQVVYSMWSGLENSNLLRV